MEKLRLGNRIKRVRKLKQIAQVDLEKKTGIKREYLSKIENEELKNPTIKTLYKIAEGLGISLTELIEPNYEPQLRKAPSLQVANCLPEDRRLKEKIERGDFVAVPVISMETAAIGLGYLDDSQIEDFVIVSSQYLEPTTDTSRYRCVRIGADDRSMLPLIRPGAIVGFDSSITDLSQLNKKVTLLKLEGEANPCMVRRLLLQRNYLLALPDNMEEYGPVVVTSMKRKLILGQVVWVSQEVE